MERKQLPPKAEALDWSDDDIDYSKVEPDAEDDGPSSEEILQKHRLIFLQSEPKSLYQSKQISSRPKLFYGDVKTEHHKQHRVVVDLPSHKPSHRGISHLPAKPIQTKVMFATSFPTISANIVMKLTIPFLTGIWETYKRYINDEDLPVEESLLAVHSFPHLLDYINSHFKQKLLLNKIQRLKELETDDFYEFASFIDAILPFVDEVKILAAQNPEMNQEEDEVDKSRPISASGWKDDEDLDDDNGVSRSRPLSASSKRSKSSKSRHSSRPGSSGKGRNGDNDDEENRKKKFSNNRPKKPCHFCCSFPACLCYGKLPDGLVKHIQQEAQAANREEVEFSETVMHQLQIVYNRLVHEHRGKLRIRHIFPLLEELKLPYHASRLPKEVWDYYDTYYLDNMESMLELVTYLTAEDEKEKDPLEHLYKYELPDWLKGEFKPAEILLFQHQFSLIDVDGGGSIDPFELQQLLAAFGSPVTVEESQAIVEKYDIDGSGTVDFVEFMILIYKIQRGTIDMAGNDLAQALMEAMAQIRIFEEIEEVNTHPPDLVEVGHFGGRVVVCQFRIHGPPGTLFEGRIIPMQMTFRDGYPYRPPEVLFRCRIFHMNILNQLDGNSHMLHLNQVWGSDWSIVKLLEHVIHLLKFPDITLLPKPYNELYDILETEYMKLMKEKYLQAQIVEQERNEESQVFVAETSHISSISRNHNMIIGESTVSQGSTTFGNQMSLATNISQNTPTSRATMPIEIVKAKFSRLNRVQTMHLSVLYLYIYDNAAYSTLARTTGKSQQEIDAEEAELEGDDNDGDDDKKSEVH